MAPKSKEQNPKPAGNGSKKKPAKPEPPKPSGALSMKQQAAIESEARALGDNLLFFPGKLARRVIWSGKIHLAAERDANDLIKTPFPEDEPKLTLDEIHAHRNRIEYLRVVQSRWRALLVGQKQAAVNFEAAAAEAGQHKETLLRFFSLRYKNNPDGLKWLADVRAGSGDADLVQDVSDILERCKKEQAAIDAAPRGEGKAAARLAALSPTLSRLLSAKSLTAEAQDGRKLRDAVYTLMINTERRLRAAAEYWYTGTERLKDYAPFPASAATATGEEDEEDLVATGSGEPATPVNSDSQPADQ